MLHFSAGVFLVSYCSCTFSCSPLHSFLGICGSRRDVWWLFGNGSASADLCSLFLTFLLVLVAKERLSMHIRGMTFDPSEVARNLPWLCSNFIQLLWLVNCFFMSRANSMTYLQWMSTCYHVLSTIFNENRSLALISAPPSGWSVCDCGNCPTPTKTVGRFSSQHSGTFSQPKSMWPVHIWHMLRSLCVSTNITRIFPLLSRRVTPTLFGFELLGYRVFSSYLFEDYLCFWTVLWAPRWVGSR